MSHANWADTEGMTGCPTTQLAEAVCGVDARRPWTSRFIHWVVEARSHRVICLVFGIWLLNAFDLAFTILSHEQGMLHEENPLARHMLQYGAASIILYKIGLVLIGSYPLLRFRRARITELGAYVILAAYAFLAIHWSTCYDLYTVTNPDSIDLAAVQALTG
ncbi:MAG: DUF5658 family protein [Phycisphaerae bacterium]